MSVTPLPEQWDGPRIKAELERRGLTLNFLSTSHGYERNAASRAIREPYPFFERVIAEALGEKPWVIWPDRYDARHRSIVRRGRPRKEAIAS